MKLNNKKSEDQSLSQYHVAHITRARAGDLLHTCTRFSGLPAAAIGGGSIGGVPNRSALDVQRRAASFEPLTARPLELGRAATSLAGIHRPRTLAAARLRRTVREMREGNECLREPWAVWYFFLFNLFFFINILLIHKRTQI